VAKPPPRGSWGPPAAVCFDLRLGRTLRCACPLEVDRAEHAVGGMPSVGGVFVDERGYWPRRTLQIVGRITDALRSETTATMMIFLQPGSSMSKRCSGALSYSATPKLKPSRGEVIRSTATSPIGVSRDWP
jgi:hypothetical protein